MSKTRTDRRLEIWKKVEECEKALTRIHEVDSRVNKLIAVEKLLKKRGEIK